MKHLLEVRVQVACLVALFSLQLAAGLLDGAWIKGTTDKCPLSYKAGEEIAFTLEPMGVEGEIPDGEYFLGMAYSFGNGVEIDFKKALELYRKAAAQGDTRAMSSVAEAYGSGNGVERDVQEELRWLRNACSAGSRNACGLLESINPETGNLRYFEENK